MRTVFRVDSSTHIGSGHLMRCLTLAKQLDSSEVIFVSRTLDGNLNSLIKTAGYRLVELPKVTSSSKYLQGYEKWLAVTQEIDAKQTLSVIGYLKIDLLIIDSYAINKTWEAIVRPKANRIMVIDDLANREHDCDILLDQNYYFNMGERYNKLVPRGCKLLLGPQYVLLRDEFYQARKSLRKRDGEIRNIFIFFGGSDLSNATNTTLQALLELDLQGIIIDVVVGASNMHKETVKAICDSKPNLKFHCQIENMADLMAHADLAIGGGGTATWERCFLGLPSIVVILAENQRQLTEEAYKLNLLWSFFNHGAFTKEKLIMEIQNCFYQKSRMKYITEQCLNFMPDQVNDWQNISF